MAKKISVKKALVVGHLVINVPIILGSFLLYVVVSHPQFTVFNDTATLASMVVAVLLIGLLYRAVVVPKWRIWAFENVAYLHELQACALQQKLLFNPKSFYSKLEIKLVKDRQRLQQIAQILAQKELYNEDTTLPKETHIYYSKSQYITSFIIAVTFFAVGVYCNSYSEIVINVLGFIFILIASTALVRTYRLFIKRKTPQITITDQGISTANTAFKSWDVVYHEDVIKDPIDTPATYFLIYKFDPNGNEKVPLGPLQVTNAALKSMLFTYRLRYEKT